MNGVHSQTSQMMIAGYAQAAWMVHRIETCSPSTQPII